MMMSTRSTDTDKHEISLAAAATRPDRPFRGHAVLARPPAPPGRYVEHVVGRRVRAQHGAAHLSSLSRSATILLNHIYPRGDATAADGPPGSECDLSVSRACAPHDIIAMGIHTITASS